MLMASEEPSLPATTTGEQDRHTLGQRRIDLIWEHTQALIAVAVVLTTLGVAAMLTIQGRGDTAFIFLVGLGNLVIGFYFGRTNHARLGGVKDTK